jgi:CelD/BcsL family acetyltransferase involved in cellulose biosynthesis
MAMDVAARALPPLAPLEAATKDALPGNSRAAAETTDFALIEGRLAFDALESEWNDLFSRAGKPTHVYQTFNFCWHWANHFLASADDLSGIHLSLVIGRRNGRLIMVWPLVAERVRGITQIFWMGDPVSQYGDALVDIDVDPHQVLGGAFEFLRRHTKSDILRLRRVRSDANIAPLMADIGAHVADRQIAPFMDLASAADFASFEQRYSSKVRRNRRRLARRLEDKGPVTFVRLHGGIEARELAQKAIALKALWLKDRGLLSTAIADERTTRLFADLAEGREKPTGCIVAALQANGKTAALEVSFACKRRLAIHLIVYDLDYEKSGVGVLLLEQSLRDGYDEGLQVLDMLAPGDPYKFDWCDQSDDVLDYTKPLSLKGHLYARLYLGFLRGRLKLLLKAMPPPLRRLMRDGYARAALSG